MLADGVSVEFVYAVYFVPMALLLFMVPLVEAVIAWPITGLRLTQSYWIWFVANIASAAGGCLVLWAFGGRPGYLESLLDAGQLGHALSRGGSRLACYFGESIMVEALVWWLVLRQRPSLRPRHWFLSLLAANGASYSLLIALMAI